MRRYLILSVILLLVGCGSKEQQRLGEPRVVKCAIAAAVDSVRRDFAALSTADDAVNLAFKISGRVVDIPVAKGVVVRKGELLAELDRRDAENAKKFDKFLNVLWIGAFTALFVFFMLKVVFRVI